MYDHDIAALQATTMLYVYRVYVPVLHDILWYNFDQQGLWPNAASSYTTDKDLAYQVAALYPTAKIVCATMTLCDAHLI